MWREVVPQVRGSGLVSRTRAACASGGGGGGAAARASYRLDAWAQVVGGLGLHDWLLLRVLRPDELAPLQPEDPGEYGAAPAWRSREDWTAF